jgi:hypothetical protein
VDQIIDGEKNYKDSSKVLFLFTKFPRENIQVLYSIDGISYTSGVNGKSNIMPLLDQVALVIPLNVKRVILKIEASKLTYKWPGLENKKVYIDTVSVN